jgi:hypothetical protein
VATSLIESFFELKELKEFCKLKNQSFVKITVDFTVQVRLFTLNSKTLKPPKDVIEGGKRSK